MPIPTLDLLIEKALAHLPTPSTRDPKQVVQAVSAAVDEILEKDGDLIPATDALTAVEQLLSRPYITSPVPVIGHAWVIDEDLINDGEGKGVNGPRDAAEATIERLKAGEGIPFQILDSDREIYYRGHYLGPDDERMFSPLEDWGTPNDGATIIQYRQKLADGSYGNFTDL